MAQLSWPVRFEVTVNPFTGPAKPYSVLKWLNEAMALAMASEVFVRSCPTATIYSIEVTSLGPAPRSNDDTVDIGRDLCDRMES